MALNYQEIKGNPERVSNIKLFINKCNWEGIKYPPYIDNSKKFEKNNSTIALTILYFKEKETLSASTSKHNSAHEKLIILSLIPNEVKKVWHYLAIKKFVRIIT